MKAAVVVGIDHYAHAPLGGCVEDAVSVTGALETHHDGVLNFSVLTILSSAEVVTRVRLRSALVQLFSGSFETVLFYFAGHGTINDLGGYVVTQDATRYDEGISMSDILTMANRSRAREVFIVLDCCHSGAFGSVAATENSHAHLRQGLSVLSASGDTESAFEMDGHGLFTGLFVEALYGGASDLLGRVTVADVFGFVDRHLGPWNQRPLFKCHVSQLTLLRQCNPRLEVSVLRLLPKIFPTPDHVFALDPSYERYESVSDASLAESYNIIRQFRAAGLVGPSKAEHMYFAAMLGNSCRLTRLGQYYWQLCHQQRI